MTLRILRSMFLALGLLIGPAATSAWACPFCGEANGTDASRTRAYELSIVFMLAMPALVFSGFAYGFYRLSRSAANVARLSESSFADEASSVDPR